METLRYPIISPPTQLVDHLEKSLESVPRVHSVRIERNPACVIVEHDGADTEEIVAALREEGVDVRP